MHSADEQVLRSLLDWRLAGEHAVLATLIGAWDNPPRPLGSLLALSESGKLVGSVSGGCIEGELLHAVRTNALLLSPRPPQRRSYDVDADRARRLGSHRGGTLELFLEFSPTASSLRDLLRHLEGGLRIRRNTNVHDGRVHLDTTPSSDRRLHLSDDHVGVLLGPVYRMLLIGAGELSECIARMALMCGFKVTVCEPREDCRHAWQVAGVALLHDMPQAAVRGHATDCNTCVIALSGDTALDDPALVEALAGDALYIGAIEFQGDGGPRRQRLLQHTDLPYDQADRLKRPAGVYLGSETAAEVALSVMAEVVAAKNGVVNAFDWTVAGRQDAMSMRAQVDGHADGPDF
jgi:xanthine dehydrogenase accessory factor